MIFLQLLLFWLQANANCTLQIQIDGMIGVGTYDYIQTAEKKAKELGCTSKLLLINTPGGDLQSTRKIVQRILNSPTPYLCLVYPSGGHAGSAGAIIMQSCHVAGAMKASNLGAATPVQASGQGMPEDLKKKVLNDTISWLEGITKARERNLDFSKEIITEAKAVSALEAEKLGAIDIAVESIDEFLTFAATREVKLQEDNKEQVVVGSIENLKPNLRYHLLQTFADPQLSYFIFMGSLGLLYFEFTHPGSILPGVAGGLGLIISLISFHKLDVQWGGLALMVLGILFFILEAFVPSFGALGIGGIIAFTIGGVFLFEEGSYYQIPMSDILLTSFVLGVLLFGISTLAYRAQKRRKTMGMESVVGEEAEVIFVDAKNNKTGQVLWRGERWKFQAEESLEINDKVEIVSHHRFALKVKKI